MTDSLYRIFSHDGALLYVGVTANVGRRLGQHEAGKAWWDQVASATIQQFPDRATALAAEVAAIKAEQPVHNVLHSLSQPTRRTAAALELIDRRLVVGQLLRSMRRDARLTTATFAAALDSAVNDPDRAITEEAVALWEATGNIDPDMGVFIDDLLDGKGLLRQAIEAGR